MAHERLARRYATAVFTLAKEAQLIDRVGSDLHTMSDALHINDDILAYFRSPVIDRTAKILLLTSVFEGNVDSIALHTLLLLVRKRRELIFPEIVLAYDGLARAERETTLLHITTIRPLEQNELTALVDRLSLVYNQRFDVKQEVAPEIIGGARFSLDDRRVDGSVAGRLDALAGMLFSKS